MGVPRLHTHIVIVNYKSQRSARALLESLSPLLDGEAFTATLVEAGEDRPFVRELQEWEPARRGTLSVLQLGSNDGFAWAVNEVFGPLSQKPGPDYIALINPDVMVTPEVMRAMTIFAAGREEVGVTSVRLIDDRGRVDRGCARRRWNLRRLWAEVLGFPRASWLLGCRPRNVSMTGSGAISVDYVSGALLLCRSEILGSGLNTLLPMYLEDQELCMRARRRGFAVVVLPSLSAEHLGGLSRGSFAGPQAKLLRKMELCEAPALAMALESGYRRLPVRFAVLVGAAMRLTLILPVSALRRDVEWFSRQVALCSAYISWAVFDRPMAQGRVLHEMLREVQE